MRKTAIYFCCSKCLAGSSLVQLTPVAQWDVDFHVDDYKSLSPLITSRIHVHIPLTYMSGYPSDVRREFVTREMIRERRMEANASQIGVCRQHKWY